MRFKIRYEFLFRNGERETQEIAVFDEEGAQQLGIISDTVTEAFREDDTGYLTLGDGVTSGVIIRLSDVSSMRTTVTQEGDADA